MDLDERMAELDARIAARRAEADRRLGASGPAAPAPAADPDPREGADAAPGGEPDERRKPSTDIGRILAVFDRGLEIPGLFTIPGIVLKIVFVLLCLSALLNLLWALSLCWVFAPFLAEAFLAWGLWHLCAKGKRR